MRKTTKADRDTWLAKLDIGSSLICVADQQREHLVRAWTLTGKTRHTLSLMSGNRSLTLPVPSIADVTAITDHRISFRIDPFNSNRPYIVTWQIDGGSN